MSKKAVIVGAGITGLSAAWKLAEAGYQVKVVEQDSDLGGMSGTFTHGDAHLDYGPHKLFTVLAPIMQTIQELFHDDELLRIKKKSRVRLRGRYLNFPLGLKDIFLGLGLVQGFRCGMGYAVSLVQNSLRRQTPETYEDWVVARFGRPIYNLLLGPYATKIWGPPTTLSRELAESRIAAPNLLEMIKQMVLGIRKNSPVINADYFHYPRQGARAVSVKLAEKIRGQQGEIHLNQGLMGLELDSNHAIRRLRFSDGTSETLTPEDVCVCTIPLVTLVRLLGNELPVSAQAAARKLKTRNLILFYLVLDQPRVMEDNWLFFPEAQYPFNRIFEQKAFSPEMVPSDKTVLCLEITCAPEDPIWQASDTALTTQMLSALQDTGLLQSRVLDSFTRRLENGYPVYDRTFHQKLDQVMAGVNQISNLYSVGRQGGMSYTGIADSMDIGFSSAAFIAEGKRKADDWLAYAQKFYHYLVVD